MFAIAKRAAWRFAPELTYHAKEWLLACGQKERSPSEVFSEVYRNNSWGGNSGEFYSGPGSDRDAANSFVDCVNSFIGEHNIKSVVDLGCGDFRVSSRLSQDIQYVGVDVVPGLIAHNNAKFGNERVRFELRDIIRDELPDGELCILRQVFQHLSNRQIEAILPKLNKYAYSIVAEHHPSRRKMRRPNIDKTLGVNTRIHCGSGVFLDEPPFSLPNATLQKRLPIPKEVEPGETLAVYIITHQRGTQKITDLWHAAGRPDQLIGK